MRLALPLLVLQAAAGMSGLCSGTTCIAIDPSNDSSLVSIGPSLDRRCSPCSTFKIVLSLIGYDTGLLQDEQEPIWAYDGSPVPLESHKAAQSPRTWMDRSVVWYSKVLARKTGKAELHKYVSRLAYGNGDLSGPVGDEDGFATAHLMSSLQISPREQAFFLKNLVCGRLPVSHHAVEMTKRLLYSRTFPGGWRMFGKSGTGISQGGTETTAWYVGWLEKEGHVRVFVLLQENPSPLPTKEERQETVWNILSSSGIDIR